MQVGGVDFLGWQKIYNNLKLRVPTKTKVESAYENMHTNTFITQNSNQK